MLALNILKKTTNAQERANDYASTIKRNLQRSIIDALIIKKEKIEDKIKELKEIYLETDINSGRHQMTATDCELRFNQIIAEEYQLELLEREMKIKQASFDKYFK